MVGVYVSSRRVCPEYVPDRTGVGVEVFPCSGDGKFLFYPAAKANIETNHGYGIDIFRCCCSALDSGSGAYSGGCCGGQGVLCALFG